MSEEEQVPTSLTGTTWNYRIMIGLDGMFSIREVYYDANGLITTWTMMPMELYGESIEDIAGDWELMSQAFGRPILMERELENQFEQSGSVALPSDIDD